MAAKVSSKTSRAPRHAGVFDPPATVSHPALLTAEGDSAFRQTLYLMVTAFG
ncbi:MAG: hypothetical protein JWL62_379, partial [Hyphomicrobiales bacterium]|nr:hypothetical protein [Hyphomicrobiales bacterium]